MNYHAYNKTSDITVYINMEFAMFCVRIVCNGIVSRTDEYYGVRVGIYSLLDIRKFYVSLFVV